MPSAVFASHTASEGRGSTLLHDLVLHPNVNGLHPFSPNHFNRKGAWKVNYNHLVWSREQRENVLYSRINCPSSECHWGESYSETGEKHWAVEESPEEKESLRTNRESTKFIQIRKKTSEHSCADGGGKPSWYMSLPRRWAEDPVFQ